MPNATGFNKCDCFFSDSNVGATVSFIDQVQNNTLAVSLTKGQGLAKALLGVMAGDALCVGIRVSTLGIYKDSLVDNYNGGSVHGNTNIAGQSNTCLLARIQYQGGLGRSMKPLPFPPQSAYQDNNFVPDFKYDGKAMSTWVKALETELKSNWSIWSLDKNGTTNPEVPISGVNVAGGILTIITANAVTPAVGQKVRLRSAKWKAGFPKGNGLYTVTSAGANGLGGTNVVVQESLPTGAVYVSGGQLRVQNYVASPVQSLIIERAGDRKRGSFIYGQFFKGRRRR